VNHELPDASIIHADTQETHLAQCVMIRGLIITMQFARSERTGECKKPDRNFPPSTYHKRCGCCDLPK